MAFLDEASPVSAQPSAADQAAAPFFAAGRRLEAEGCYDEAFAAFAEGNRIKWQSIVTQQEWGREKATAALLKGMFTSLFLIANATSNPTVAPIFIVGLPRSGSTLIEQILASHPAVHGMGESSALPRILQGAFPFDSSGYFDPSRMADAYLKAIQADGWVSVPRFTDKQLSNFRYIGFIHMMFPRAVILHAQRDPMDSCLSSFRTHFGSDAGAQKYCYDLADLGRRYRAYRDLMSHWNMVLMGRMVTVDYEELVANPESKIRWLLDICGLAFNESCLRFHENTRDVFTASAEQVRRPIFSDSIGRWRQYRKHLRPLIEALGSYAPTDT